MPKVRWHNFEIYTYALAHLYDRSWLVFLHVLLAKGEAVKQECDKACQCCEQACKCPRQKDCARSRWVAMRRGTQVMTGAIKRDTVDARQHWCPRASSANHDNRKSHACTITSSSHSHGVRHSFAVTSRATSHTCALLVYLTRNASTQPIPHRQEDANQSPRSNPK